MNGAHMLEYKHRLDLDRVDTLAISGKVNVQAIGFIPSSVSRLNAHHVLFTVNKILFISLSFTSKSYL